MDKRTEDWLRRLRRVLRNVPPGVAIAFSQDLHTYVRVLDLSDDDSRRYVVIGGRRWDRAISLLKRAGLVSYAGGGRWVALSGRAL